MVDVKKQPETYDLLVLAVMDAERKLFDLPQETRDVELKKRFNISSSVLREIRGTKDLLDFPHLHF